VRLEHYRCVLHRELMRMKHLLPARALVGTLVSAGCD
jgi:hypothetical protein